MNPVMCRKMSMLVRAVGLKNGKRTHKNHNGKTNKRAAARMKVKIKLKPTRMFRKAENRLWRLTLVDLHRRRG